MSSESSGGSIKPEFLPILKTKPVPVWLVNRLSPHFE